MRRFAFVLLAGLAGLSILADDALAQTCFSLQAELMRLSLQRYVSPRTEEIARIYANTGVLPAPKRQDV